MPNTDVLTHRSASHRCVCLKETAPSPRASRAIEVDRPVDSCPTRAVDHPPVTIATFEPTVGNKVPRRRWRVHDGSNRVVRQKPIGISERALARPRSARERSTGRLLGVRINCEMQVCPARRRKDANLIPAVHLMTGCPGRTIRGKRDIDMSVTGVKPRPVLSLMCYPDCLAESAE